MPEDMFPVAMVRGVPVVTAPEEIDVTNATELRAAMAEAAVRGHGSSVVDMSGTAFCDTAGLHALVSAHRQAVTEDGCLALVITGAAVLRIFSITGLDQVVTHFASLPEALAAMSPEGRT